jgi:hypothetical protein
LVKVQFYAFQSNALGKDEIRPNTYGEQEGEGKGSYFGDRVGLYSCMASKSTRSTAPYAICTSNGSSTGITEE